MHVGRGAALDVDERRAQAHGDGTRLSVSNEPRAARRLRRPDRGDDGGGAARESLGEGAVRAAGSPLLDADASYLDLVPQVLAERQQGVTSDAGQQRAREL